MFDNILKAQLKIYEYSRNNQQNYDNAFFNQLRITISSLLVEFSKLSFCILFSQCKISLR